MTRPPLRDVAALAGVSEPTVSRVLNGKVGVASATRDKVLGAIVDLGYDESVARNRATTGLVGVITPELDNPIFPSIVHALDSRLAQLGYTLHIGMATGDTVPEERQAEIMVDHQVEGIVFLAGHHADTTTDLTLYRDLADRKMPFVLVGGAETDLPVPHLYTDEREAAGRGIEHLVSLGHERIGLVIGPRRFVPAQRIIEGYRSTMERFGLPVNGDSIVETLFTLEGGQAGAARLFENGVTGIMASNDLMALGVVRAAGMFGLDVPDQVSVVGYDGTPLTAYFDPPLTTLRQPAEALGKMAADALASEIDGTHHHRGVFTFSAELIARGSTGRLT